MHELTIPQHFGALYLEVQKLLQGVGGIVVHPLFHRITEQDED